MIDLTYLGGVFKSARDLRKLLLNLELITVARADMAHLNISAKSPARVQRATEKEISVLRDYLHKHPSLPMRDIIQFAIKSARHVEEIARLRWILTKPAAPSSFATGSILDRSTAKTKNPLLGKTSGIVHRQSWRRTISSDFKIFSAKVDIITTIFPRAKIALGIKICAFMTYVTKEYTKGSVSISH